MKFTPHGIDGVFVIDLEGHADERGFFARTLCTSEFAAHGLVGDFIQHSVAFNHHAGTLRGMHLQLAPHAEHKLVRVTRGAVYDALVDLRPGPGFGAWCAVELSADNHRQLYIPPGVAHGYQTLVDGTELAYAINVPYHAPSACGLRWDDPAVGIDWPACAARILSERDRSLPLLADLPHLHHSPSLIGS